jgi:hypothetical protein
MSASGQTPAVTMAKDIKRYSDSINTSKLYLLAKCDTVLYINDRPSYRCWNFYFFDSSRTNLVKFSCTWDGYMEWEYYFIAGKFVLVQRNVRRKSSVSPKWHEYYYGDKEIYTWRRLDRITTDHVEGAYYFQRIGLDLTKEQASR